MFSFGAIASMTTPYLSVLIAYLSGFTLEALVLGVIWTLNALFTIYFSSKAGDFHKAFKAWQKYSRPTPK
ncbi:MAG: hypothetical protein ACFFC7_07680 [Candidatus Hermodarchaeota archaeon]